MNNYQKLLKQFYQYKNIKIFKKIITDKKKIFFIKKNNKLSVLKIYLKGDTYREYNNEIKGYLYFKKKRLFKIANLINYSKNSKIYFIEIDYIKGKKANFFDYNKIFKKNIKISKKISFKSYIDKFSKFYSLRKDMEFLKIEYKIYNYLTNKYKSSKLGVSSSHGDLANYNCIKKNNDIYVFDFEKFKERIFLFDSINWLFHTLISNVSSIFVTNDFLLKNKVLINVILKYFKFFIYIKLKNILDKNKISNKEFCKYYLIYLYEKLYILLTDVNYVNNSKNRILTKKFILVIKHNINLILTNEKL